MAGSEPLPLVATRRGLDLDDVGPEAAEELRGIGQRLHLLEGEDPGPSQGSREI